MSYKERRNADEEGKFKRDSKALKENSTSISREERQKEEDDKKLGRDVGISEELRSPEGASEGKIGRGRRPNGACS